LLGLDQQPARKLERRQEGLELFEHRALAQGDMSGPELLALGLDIKDVDPVGFLGLGDCR
jgi:hypothetical protein